MNREERKSHRRIPPPIVEAHEIQHGQGQEAAPLYTEEPADPHDFRNEIPTLEVSLDAQRTPQRSDFPRTSLRSHNPRHSYEQSIQSDSGSIWEDPRALQFEVRKKRREIEEVKRRCIQSESELQNERLKSALLEEENENLRREIRRKERNGNQNIEGEVERLKANLSHKIKEIELITKELQNSKNEKEKLKEHIKISWQEFEAFKKQSEENRKRLQQTLDEFSTNQRFGSQNEAILQITQQKNKIASELKKTEEKIGEMKKVIEKLEYEKAEKIEIKEKEIKRLNEIIEKQEEIIMNVKNEKEELNRKGKKENKETQTLSERPPEVILPPSTEVEELKPEKVVKARNENSLDAEEIRESIVEETLPVESEEMKFEFSSPTENNFERIFYSNISDPFMALNNGNKKKNENNSAFQPISNLFEGSSIPFEEDINPEITRIPSHDVIKSNEPEIQTWFIEKENKPENNIENPPTDLSEEYINSDCFLSNGPDAADFFNNPDQHISYKTSPQAFNSSDIANKQFSYISPSENIENIFDPKIISASKTSIESTQSLFNNHIENLFDPQPILNQKNQPLQSPADFFEKISQPPQSSTNLFEKSHPHQKITQANQKPLDETIESIFNLSPPDFSQYSQNIEIPKTHKSSQSQIIAKTSNFMPEESAEDFFSHLTNNKNPSLAYGGIPSSLFD